MEGRGIRRAGRESGEEGDQEREGGGERRSERREEGGGGRVERREIRRGARGCVRIPKAGDRQLQGPVRGNAGGDLAGRWGGIAASLRA